MFFKDKMVKTLIVHIIVIICINILSAIFVSIYISNEYKGQMYEAMAIIIQNINEKYGEVESRVIKELYKMEGIDSSLGKEILKKYGYEVDDMEMTIGDVSLKSKINIVVITFSMITIFLLIFVIVIYFVNYKRKINNIHEYTKRLLNGDYALDIRENDESDLSILKNEIYNMTVMLKEKSELINKEKIQVEKMLADISHQVKTPLTSLNIINELLRDGDMSELKRNEFLDSMQKELFKVEWLIKNLLNLARLDSKTIVLKKENVNLYSLLNKSLKNFEIVAEVKEVKININCDKNINVLCDENWTLEAINNVIKNAIEHGAKNINVVGASNNIYTMISISDDGEGIEKCDIPHIFDRFYKTKNSNSDSVGIGLSFVKSIIKNQDGDIRVKSKLGEGTSFVIKMYNYKNVI